MLLRQEPKNKIKFMSITDAQLNKDLQINGFCPMYYWDKVFYYTKCESLEKYLQEREVKRIV